MKKIIPIVFSLLLLGPTHLLAQEWKVDPVHSGILFDIKHIYSTVRGNFSDFTGDMFFDPDNLGKSRFGFAVRVDSINTLNDRRDTHLRSEDFFAANQYPMMTFKSARVTHVGGNKYLVEGNLTIKDVSKNVVLEFIYWGQKEYPFKKGQMVAGFDCPFKINRLEYHVGNGKYYNMGVLAKDVDILITLEVLRDK